MCSRSQLKSPALLALPATASSVSASKTKARKSEVAMYDPHLILLALKTLGSFNFADETETLLCLLRDTIISYLDYELPIIRKEAAVTISKLVPKLSHQIHYGPASHVIFDVLKRLVIVGISDSLPVIRYTVLSTLSADLDSYLAQAEILQSLFIALNDEVFAVREVAINLLGRLSPRNPALVQPLLRKTLTQLLSELQHHGHHETVDQEESSKLLGHLIAASNQLIKPYVAPILHVLVPKLTSMDISK